MLMLVYPCPEHDSVGRGREEYVNAGGITTNTFECYYSAFKHGMRGVRRHCVYITANTTCTGAWPNSGQLPNVQETC